MTDVLFDLTHDGPVGKQQITNVSRVAYNFRLDNDELEARQAGSQKSLWPTAPTDDRSLYVLPRDLCFSFKRRAGVRGGDGMMTVFSGFAGAGRSGQTLRQFIESLSFAGVAGGQGAVFDTTGKNPRFPEFAGVLGGLVTMVNNGKDRISNGDYLYWDLPEPGTERTELGDRGSRRVTAVLRPYRPGKDKVAANAVKEAIRMSGQVDPKSPSDEAAVAFKRFTTQTTLNAFEALLSSGLVRYDAAALGTDQNAARARQANAARWAAASQNEREGHITRVARALGCRNVRDSAGTSKVDMPSMPGTSLRQYVFRQLTGDEMLIHTEGGYTPSGDKGEIVCNQMSAVSDVVSGAASAEFFVQRRIVMRALTPGAPGKEFDANMAHYMM
jgi:hypothetical protein